MNRLSARLFSLPSVRLFSLPSARLLIWSALLLTSQTLLATQSIQCAFADDASFKKMMDSGVVALKQSNFEEAIKGFSEAKKVAEQDHNDFYLALSLSRIADVYQRQKKYVEAEPLFKQALTLAEKSKAPGKNVVAMCLGSLGALYIAQNNLPQAESQLKSLIAMLDGAGSGEVANPRFLPSALDNLAVVYRSQKKFAQAQALYRRAIPLWEQVAGADDPDTATSMNNLATLYYYERKYSEAEPLFIRALAIREKKLGAKNPDVINTANHLILVYRAEKKTAEAEELSKRFADAVTDEGEPLPILTGSGVDTDEWSKHVQAGREHLKAERYSEAEQELQAAVQEAEKGGVEDRRLAATLYNLGHVYAKQKDYAKAESTYKRSLSICEKVCGDKDKEVLKTQTTMAKLYTEQKKYELAEPLFKHVIAVQEKGLGRDNQAVAEAMTNLAAMYAEAGRKSESASYEKRAKSIGAKNTKAQ
jgi:tetratricopeptide (TPR) repeat protein